MQLEDFYDYKNQFAEDLLTDRGIVSLITDEQDPDMSKTGELMYTRVLPFEYLPETIEQAGTYIFCEVEAQRMTERTYFNPVLYIWILSHKSKLRLPEGGVRTDKLVTEIAKKMNGSRKYGLGELELYAVRRFSPLADYNGKMMTFHAKEFNRPSPAREVFPIPSNRKKGI
jgi:hypothetical protein